MLLVIDVGNTDTVLGIYDRDQLIADWRVRTEWRKTADEFNVLISQLFSNSLISIEHIQRTVISCVVPPMVRILNAFCLRYLKSPPIFVNARTSAGMPIEMENPDEVGADRIVNAVGAYNKYQCSLIIIDFGTATTFDVISEKGAYIGGIICPGIVISGEALFMKASKLPRVEILEAPKTVIGKNTIQSIQSGMIFGYAALVDGLVERITSEMASSPRVVATGGLSILMKHVSKRIEIVDQDLTLTGLKLISDKLSS